MKKRMIVCLLAGSLALMLAACGSKGGEETNQPETNEAADMANADDAQPEEDTAEQTTPTSDDSAITTEDVGKYMIYEYEANGQKVDHATLETAGMGETYLDLKEDGTGELLLFDQKIDVTWRNGIVTVYGTTDYTYTRVDDTLTLDMAGVTYTMVREGGQVSETETDASASDESADASGDETAAAAVPAGEAPSGDGLVSEEMVQKGYVWMNKINKDIFNATYEDLAAYFGTDGKFEKEEYSDHMEQNRRYYFWISNEDDTHYIYVNLGEKDPEGAPGVYKVTGFNSSGFSSSDAEAKYLDELKAEASEADKAAASSAEMKEDSHKISVFGDDDNFVNVKYSMPSSGWSIKEGSSDFEIVENEDPQAFGAGFIKFSMKDTLEKFDFYKDDFENYKEIDSRTIGGVEMKGRTYKSIGYEWTEYIGVTADGKAVGVGIVDIDISEGTMGDKILNSVSFQ
ncbi:MAG: hypothetical protein IK078_07750 [Lachnospiraceae bacterium]|nr:hypothetical protein [Lachnospiraceae bacterium]